MGNKFLEEPAVSSAVKMETAVFFEAVLPIFQTRRRYISRNSISPSFILQAPFVPQAECMILYSSY
jgi:hypothetical protein